MSQNQHTAKKPRTVYIVTIGNADGDNQRQGVYGTLRRGLDAFVEVINDEILDAASNAVRAHIVAEGPINETNSPVLYLDESLEPVYPENDWDYKAYPLPFGWKGTPIAEMGYDKPATTYAGWTVVDHRLNPRQQPLQRTTFTVNDFGPNRTMIQHYLPHYKVTKKMLDAVKIVMDGHDPMVWPGISFVLRRSAYATEVVTIEQVVVE